MLDVESYEEVFRTGHYSDALVNGIIHNQAQLGGRTFFERLLELLQIKWRRIYPPKGESQLRDLHKRIIDAPITLHYKHCLFFYLLKDLSPYTHTTPEISTKFATEVHLDKRFWTFIEGIWELDQLQFETAVGNLTHPAIIPTFPDEILMALLGRKDTYGGTTEEDVLPLAYYHCAGPPLGREEVRVAWVKYLASRNVTETFYWIRTRAEHEQKRLLEVFVEQVLSGRAWGDHSMEKLYAKEDKAMEFVSLPFSEEEERWVDHFLTEGNGRTLRGAEDTVLMRRLATGRLTDFATEKGHKGKKQDGVNWEGLKNGVGRGLGPRRE